ncbi:Hypothetical predicted protein, partial [Mytilus galloprovincialis]
VEVGEPIRKTHSDGRREEDLAECEKLAIPEEPKEQFDESEVQRSTGCSEARKSSSSTWTKWYSESGLQELSQVDQSIDSSLDKKEDDRCLRYPVSTTIRTMLQELDHIEMRFTARFTTAWQRLEKELLTGYTALVVLFAAVMYLIVKAVENQVDGH